MRTTASHAATPGVKPAAMELKRVLWTVVVGMLSIATLALYDVVLIATLRGSPHYLAWVVGGPSAVLIVGYVVSPAVRRNDPKLSLLAYLGLVLGVHSIVAQAYEIGGGILARIGIHT